MPTVGSLDNLISKFREIDAKNKDLMELKQTVLNQIQAEEENMKKIPKPNNIVDQLIELNQELKKINSDIDNLIPKREELENKK